MRSSEIFREYIWLVSAIWKAGKISLDDLSRDWNRQSFSEGRPLARSTFNRHKSAIERIFGILIECDRSDGNRYYIVNAEEFNGNSVTTWMASMLSVNNILSENRAVQDRIMLEPISTSVDTLQLAIDAMKEDRKLELTYQGYGKEPRKYLIEPYCVRLFRQRWYILGHFTDDKDIEKFRLFAFDRIVNLQKSDVKFYVDHDFDCNQFFADYFGVMTDNRIKCQQITIRAHGQERFYLIDLPLHHSQKEIARTDTTIDYELYLRPTTDFLATIFSKAGWIEILSPQWLKYEILSWSRKMLERIDGQSENLPQWK